MGLAYYDLQTGILMKVCSKCESDAAEAGVEADPLVAHVNFYKNRSAKDGFQAWCKDCLRGRMRAYYATNKEKLKAKREANRVEPLPHSIHDLPEEGGGE